MSFDFKKFIKEPRIIILVLFLIISLIAIKPFPAEGVAVRFVEDNGSASQAGLTNPISSYPKDWERILEINGKNINSVSDYYDVSSLLESNSSVSLKTNEKFYAIKLRNDSLGIDVSEIPNSNIRFGLDINGGTRVILRPDTTLDSTSLDKVISILNARLNVYGLSDVNIRGASDLDGNQYIVAEIAGATRDEVNELLGKQGKFEAKIGNKTIFMGGDDISYVCQSADCSRITCGNQGGQDVCNFQFSLTIGDKAAQKFKEATSELSTNINNTDYLSKSIVFELDGNEYSTLQISSSLKGQAAKEVSISGSGTGKSVSKARDNARQEMKKLQTVLTVGSLPIELNVDKIDEISPLFGSEFLSNAVFVGLVALLAVALVLLFRYRNPFISLGIFFTMFSEILILLGFASFTGWNLDLIAIAGIIVAVGTGVDDQIVITDEVMRGGSKRAKRSLKEKIKKAFFIIFGSYATTVVAMLPLLWAGVGLLKGFAFTTIAGVTIGVFVTRPAYAKYIERIL